MKCLISSCLTGEGKIKSFYMTLEQEYTQRIILGSPRVGWAAATQLRLIKPKGNLI